MPNGTLSEKENVVFTYMDETWVNKNHNKGFTWKRIVSMGGYADEDGKINELPVCYDGDMNLPTGKGERLIVVHYSKGFLISTWIKF